MNKFIIVSGLSGSGKTNLAKYLSENLKVPCFAKDDIKEELFNTLGWSDKEWSLKLSLASINLLFLVLNRELQNGRPIIIEANFKPLAKEPLQKILSKYSAEVLEYHCFASPEILSERVKARAESSNRHPGHDKTLIGEIDNEFAKALEIGEVIEVDTSDVWKIGYIKLTEEGRNFLKK